MSGQRDDGEAMAADGTTHLVGGLAGTLQQEAGTSHLAEPLPVATRTPAGSLMREGSLCKADQRLSHQPMSLGGPALRCPRPRFTTEQLWRGMVGQGRGESPL